MENDDGLQIHRCWLDSNYELLATWQSGLLQPPTKRSNRNVSRVQIPTLSLLLITAKEIKLMRDRQTPCINYVCLGECKKGRDAEHNGYCQHCDKYYPRAKVRHLNKKKLDKTKYYE